MTGSCSPKPAPKEADTLSIRVLEFPQSTYVIGRNQSATKNHEGDSVPNESSAYATYNRRENDTQQICKIFVSRFDRAGALDG